MKIRYISDAGLSEGTINLIKALRHDIRFKECIRKTRYLLEMPLEGFEDDLERAVSFLQETFEYKEKVISNKRFLQFLSQQIADEFHLPKNWMDTIEDLVLFDSTLLYEEEIVLNIPDLSSNPHQTPFVSINLYAKIKRNQLDEWLDRYFKTIEDYFKRMRFQKPSKVNRKHLELMIEAKELYDSKRFKTTKDICKFLTEKYKNDDKIFELIIDEQNVRNWISRLTIDIHGK